MTNDQRVWMTFVHERVGETTESENAYLYAWKKSVAKGERVRVDKMDGMN